MSTSTPKLGLIKPASGEKFSRATYNNNLDLIDAYVQKALQARNAVFNAKQPRSSTPGAGVNWGHLIIDNSHGTQNINNDFCVLDNTGTLGAGDEVGRIRITKEGIYNGYANFTSTASPGNLNFAIQLTKVEGGVEKIATMNRSGTYGDWETTVAFNGKVLKVGDYISGYQANSNGVTWAMGVSLTYVGANS